MRVCVDIQAAIAQRAGVGRYVKSLVEHLGAFRGDDELRLFYFDFQRQGSPFPAGGARERAVRWIPGRIVQQGWKRLGFPPYDWFAGAADVYHFPNFIRPPLTRGRSVVTIHDVSFLRYPEAAEAKNLAYLTNRIARTVDRADCILTDSAFVAREICERLKAPEQKVVPIWLGLPDGFARPAEEVIAAARRRLGLDRPYLLFVGTLEPRKNIPFLAEVFERLTDFDGDLVLAGGHGWKTEPILERLRASPRADRIRHLDYVAEADLPALYAGAELFVFPSLYEGFGFPPLEAMACGTPVLASPAGSLKEVLGDGAELLAGYAADDWAACAQRLLTDSVVRADSIRRGLARAARFDWRETARRTWQAYRGEPVDPLPAD